MIKVILYAIGYIYISSCIRLSEAKSNTTRLFFLNRIIYSKLAISHTLIHIIQIDKDNLLESRKYEREERENYYR